MLKQHFETVFEIIFPEEFWLKFKTPSMLVEEVAFVNVKLDLNFTDNRNQWDFENNSKLMKDDINPIFYVL